MSLETPGMKPQETVILLLGELRGQVGSLQSSVDTSLTTQASINATVQTELSNLKRDLGSAVGDIAVLRAQMPHRAPWWSVASGVASLAAILVVALQLFNK